MNSSVRFDIIVRINGTDYYVDTYDVVSVPLNYSISDIRNVDKRNSSYSLSITIPETRNNRFIFDNISDLNSDLTFFNPNLKTPCVLLVDSIAVFSGTLQLIDVSVDSKSGEYKYDIVVYSESDDFFKEIGDSYLTDLDFTELNHIYELQTITASWPENWTNGYYYPFIDLDGISLYYINGQVNPTNQNIISKLGLNVYKINKFQPATYIKYILNKIFTSVGYSYQSNFLNSSIFENLLMPFSKKSFVIDPDTLLQYQFYVGSVGNQGTTSSVARSFYNNSNTYLNGFNLPAWFNTPQIFSFSNTSTPYNNDNGLWDVATNTYTHPSATYIEGFGFKFKCQYYNWGLNGTYNANLVASYMGLPGQMNGNIYADTILVVCRSMDFNGNVNPNWSTTPTIQDLMTYRTIPFNGSNFFSIRNQYNNPDPANTGLGGFTGNRTDNIIGYNSEGDPLIESDIAIYTLALDSSTTDRQTLRPGEQVRAFIVTSGNYNNYDPAQSGGFYVNTGITPPFYALIHKDLFYFNISNDANVQNLLSNDLVTGISVDYNQIMPENFKQKDFITSLIKMFNLYIEPSKSDPYTLIIEPRDDYYAQGTIVDWTQKLDLEYEVEYQILGETQNKATLFTYKEDGDFYNQDTKNKIKRLYGDLRYIIDNDFVEGEKKIEINFSPTPLTLLDNSEKIVCPQIWKLNNGKKVSTDSFNYRILFRSPTASGVLNLPLVDKWVLSDGLTQSIQYSYPYVGHFYPDPYQPTADLNFGQAYLYYENIPTNNNLFRNYWQTTMNEINDINSKIVTAYFYFTPQDMYNFRFNNVVYCEINGQAGYYRVNKIINYDPTDIKSTRVELLKAIDVSGFVPDTDNPTTVVIKSPIEGVQFINGALLPTDGKNTLSGGGTVLTGINNNVGPKSMTVGDNNLSANTSNSIVGSNNQVNTPRTMILGDSNNVNSGDLKMIIGASNSIDSSKSLVVGSNNNVTQGSYKINIIGDNTNVISSTATAIYSTYSFSNAPGLVNGIFSLGDNNYFGPSSSGTYIIGSGMTALSSNELIFGNNFTSIIFPAGATISGLTYEQVTIADLNTILIPGNLLIPGALYKIDTQQTTWKDNGIFLQAISTNQLNKLGTRLFLSPGTYQTTTDGFGNVWLGVWQSTLTPAIGDLVIWGGLAWSNVNGLVGAPIDDFTLDAEWSVISKDTFSNGEYIEMLLECQFDYTNNWVEKQWDGNGNIFGIGYEWNTLVFSLTINPCDYSDWNYNSQIPAPYIYDNNLPLGLYNNITSIYGNTCLRINNNIMLNGPISGNVLYPYASIYNNNIQGSILNNVCYSIFDNTNVGDISNNSNNGGIYQNSNGSSIIYNSNTGDIRINSNTGVIDYNSNKGEIFLNTNSGSITNNNNLGDIRGNSNNGDVINNSNLGPIWDNSNPAVIRNNSNSSQIRENQNGGRIEYNSNIGSIYNNTNGGDISHNSSLGNITDNSNNGLISLNSNAGYINNNSNLGGIYNNSNGDYIANNSNNGDIYNNSNGSIIDNNSNNSFIFENKNIGGISTNTNNGYIASNVNVGNINLNTNGGDIFNNSNLGNINDNSNVSFISYNSNSGDISFNDNNINVIQYNINNGYISNNTGVGGPWNIGQNINNGWISTNALADITDPIVNK